MNFPQCPGQDSLLALGAAAAPEAEPGDLAKTPMEVESACDVCDNSGWKAAW